MASNKIRELTKRSKTKSRTKKIKSKNVENQFIEKSRHKIY